MHRPRWLLACTLPLSLPALLLTGGAVRAQEKSHPSVLSQQDILPAPSPALLPQARPLAQALAAVETPKQDLFVTVGADKITLPPGALPPDPDSRPGQVADAYGRLVRDFGGVTALAPPEMVVLNTRPGIPNPYDGMPAEDALKLLLASLNPLQWDALTSESGLGVEDLSDDVQHGYFEVILPPGDVMAIPEYNPFIPVPSSEVVTLAGRDIAGARLRLGRRMQIGIPMVGGAGGTATYHAAPIAGRVAYDANSPAPASPGTVYGAVVRLILPNNPKDADLDYTAPALAQSVRVDGIETVGNLVARVGRAAGLELYADRRYETRRVMLIGRRTARGVDLLRAVAFCVTGTFRRVGPAYVLTDDLQGTDTRRQRLSRFVQEAEMMRHAAVEAASDSLVTAHGGLDGLPWLGGLGFSDAQQALPQFKRGTMGGDLSIPFALLTPAQQDYALALARQVASSGDTRLDMGGQFTLQARPHLLLLSSAAPGPFLLDYLPMYQLFQPSMKLMIEQSRRQAAEAARKNMPTLRPRLSPPALAALLAPIPRRAVLAAPDTAAEVDSVVASMKALGLNQLWLDVFSGGHSHLDKPPGGGPDILTEALARTKGTGIAVIPALNLLRWGADPPPDACDLTALGETSAQAEAWGRHYTDVLIGTPASRHAPPPPDVWVSPAAPGVEATLRALVSRLAATPGITTLALSNTTPPGYSGLGAAELGYVPALRLALLRRDHLDPVDLNWGYGPPGGADLSLPEFDDPRWGDPWPATSGALKDWNGLRDTAARDLLRHLLESAQEAGGRRVRFLVASRGDVTAPDWYGLWDNPQAPLPEISAAPPGVRPPAETDYAQAAHSRSRIALYRLSFWEVESQYVVADKLRAVTLGWDGMVLEADDAQLARLARGAAPAIPKPVP